MRALVACLRIAGLLAVVGFACYDPDFVSGVTECDPDGSCPYDWTCKSGVCVDPADTGSTGAAGASGGQGGSSTTSGTGNTTGAGGQGGAAGGSTSSSGAGGSSGGARAP